MPFLFSILWRIVEPRRFAWPQHKLHANPTQPVDFAPVTDHFQLATEDRVLLSGKFGGAGQRNHGDSLASDPLEVLSLKSSVSVR